MPTPPRSLVLDDTNGNGEFDEGDDLKGDVKITLGAYLSGLTKTSPTKNAYEIAAELEESASFNQVTDRTPALVTGQGSGEPVYIDDVAQAAKAYFESTSDGDFGDGDDLTTTIDKIEKGITTKKTGITIDRQNITLDVSLTVNLEADKLAQALSDRTIVDQQNVLLRAGGFSEV